MKAVSCLKRLFVPYPCRNTANHFFGENVLKLVWGFGSSAKALHGKYGGGVAIVLRVIAPFALRNIFWGTNILNLV